MVTPDCTTSDFKAVGVAAVTFDAVMVNAPSEFWVFATNTDCYIKQGSAPTATAGDGSVLVPAGSTVLLWGPHGAKLSVIRDTADGKATLTRVKRV